MHRVAMGLGDRASGGGRRSLPSPSPLSLRGRTFKGLLGFSSTVSVIPRIEWSDLAFTRLAKLSARRTCARAVMQEWPDTAPS